MLKTNETKLEGLPAFTKWSAKESSSLGNRLTDLSFNVMVTDIFNKTIIEVNQGQNYSILWTTLFSNFS